MKGWLDVPALRRFTSPNASGIRLAMIVPSRHMSSVSLVVLFSIAFAWVEASVVVYLRDIYYPEGFAFPLKAIAGPHIGIELIREFATLVMLGAVGVLAGSTRWSRFSFFAIAFGVWDIFFYLWLKAAIDWPVTLVDWDILFLLPLPWIGPVLAPVMISVVLVVAGLMILRIERERAFRPTKLVWGLAIAGSAIVLWTFMRDTAAGLQGAMPQPYSYGMFSLGMALYCIALFLSWRSLRDDATPAAVPDPD